MPIKKGASNTITAIKLGTTDITRIRRGGLSVWPTIDSSTLSWSGSTSITRNNTDSDYWSYDELSIQLYSDGTWVAYFWRNGIGGGSPSPIDSGTWATPTVVGVGANYQASMSVQSTHNGTWSSPIVWQTIDGTTAVRLAVRTNDAYPVTVSTTGSMLIEFRAVGIPTVIYSQVINVAITA